MREGMKHQMYNNYRIMFGSTDLHFHLGNTCCISLLINSNSPNTADVPHVIISVTMFPVTSLPLVGTVLYLVMFSVVAFSGSAWFRGRDRVTEPLAWLMARG